MGRAARNDHIPNKQCRLGKKEEQAARLHSGQRQITPTGQGKGQGGRGAAEEHAPPRPAVTTLDPDTVQGRGTLAETLKLHQTWRRMRQAAGHSAVPCPTRLLPSMGIS